MRATHGIRAAIGWRHTPAVFVGYPSQDTWIIARCCIIMAAESEIRRETQWNGNGSVPNGAIDTDRACSRKSVVPSPPVARTDVDDGPPTRASGTSSAPSLEDDLAMTLDHVKQEDPTETRAAATATPASSARDVSCMAQAVGDHRDKRPREHSLDPADYRVRKSLALPVNPTIDPPFPGTECWHPPSPSAL